MTLTWKAPIDYRGKSIGAYDNEEGAYEAPGSDFDYLALLQGKRYPVDRDIPTLYFVDPEKKISRLDCLWLLGGIPLVSARLAEFLLAQVSADIQTVRPKAIHAAGSKTQLDYLILNATHAINAIDLEKSDAKADEEGTIIYFKKIHLMEDAMTQHAIAREAQSLDLLVSEMLAEKLIAGGFDTGTGISFYSLQRKLIPYAQN